MKADVDIVKIGYVPYCLDVFRLVYEHWLSHCETLNEDAANYGNNISSWSIWVI